jgi:hypothetical protein
LQRPHAILRHSELQLRFLELRNKTLYFFAGLLNFYCFCARWNFPISEQDVRASFADPLLNHIYRKSSDAENLRSWYMVVKQRKRHEKNITICASFTVEAAYIPTVLLPLFEFTLPSGLPPNMKQSRLRSMLPDSNLDRGRGGGGAQKHHEGKEECYPRHLEYSFTSVLSPSKRKGLQC